MADTGPAVSQVLAEWIIADPVTDLARWQEGMSRYEAESLTDHAGLGETAELMCAALTHYVAGDAILVGSANESPETAVAHTIWNVLAVTLQGGCQTRLSADTSRRLRLALVAVRKGGYQSQDLGGSGFMARFFDSRSRGLMAVALSGTPTSTGATPVNLVSWFARSEPARLPPVTPGAGTATAQPGALPDQRLAMPAESKWVTLKGRARQAKDNVNPVALQHGIESVQGALTEAKIVKVDKNTGKLKIRKIGVAKAALRPAKTMRKALDGAALTEHLKSFNESSRSAVPIKLSCDAGVGASVPASSPAEFASYGSKRDYLRDWARRLVVAAGVPPTEQLVVEHADMAAAAIGLMAFLPLGAPRGISDLNQYFHDGAMPAGTWLDTFDVLYLKVVEVEARPQMTNEQITAVLDSCWNDWIRGIRERHG